MKKLLTLVLAMFIVVSITGCFKKPEKINNIKTQDLADIILNTEELQYGMLFPANEEFLTESTGLDFNKIEDYTLLEPMMIQSNTVFIAKVKENADIESVTEAFQKRLEYVQQSFEQYLPEPYELAMNGKIVTKGKYVMLAICDNVDKAVEIFNTELTK